MGEQKDLLVSVHDVLCFLPDFDSFSDPLSCPIKFPADNCRLLPVNDVIFCVDMVCDRRFVLLGLRLFPGAFGVFLPSCNSTSFRCPFSSYELQNYVPSLQSIQE